MPKLHLTKSVIDELTPSSSELVYWDDSVPGFGLKVTPLGRKVFIVIYRTKDGLSRLRKYTIGAYGQTTLAIARIAAQKVLADRNEGKDPAREKRDLRRTVVTDTVEDVVKDPLGAFRRLPASSARGTSLIGSNFATPGTNWDSSEKHSTSPLPLSSEPIWSLNGARPMMA